MGNKHKVWVTRLGLLVTVAALYLFLKDIHFRETWEAIRQTHVLWLIAGAVSIWGSLLSRAFRWRVFLGAEHLTIALSRLYHTLTIGFFGNSVLPARAGEFLRAYMLGRAEPIRFSEAFATVIVERVFDLFAVIFAFALLLIVSPFPAEALAENADLFNRMKFLGWIMGFGCCGFTALLTVMVRIPKPFHSLLERVTRWLPESIQHRLVHSFDSFVNGLGAFASVQTALRALAWTAVVWFTILLSEYCTIRAFELEVSLFGTMILMSLLAFAVMVPQAPGYLGPFQLASELTLVICFAVDKSEAKAFAIVLWFVQVIPILILGLISLHHEGLTLGQMWRSVKTRQDQDSAE